MLTERQLFNRWYVNTLADADGRFTHMPRWLKADLWLAWQAALECRHNCDTGGVCLAELSGFPGSCPQAGRRALQQPEGSR